MRYKGGKGESGLYQGIINLMPKHNRYFEGCLGGGAILQKKKRAPGGNWAIDVDPDTIRKVRDEVLLNPSDTPAPITFLQVDVISFLLCFPLVHSDLVYLDPPYLFEVRSSKRPIYKFEMTLEQHLEILSIIVELPAYILISGYDSDLYNSALEGWRKAQFNAVDHRGRVHKETVWMNYPEPLELHDYSFLGRNYRERYKIKQKIKTVEGKLERMGSQERYAYLAAVQEFLNRSYDVENRVAGSGETPEQLFPGAVTC